MSSTTSTVASATGCVAATLTSTTFTEPNLINAKVTERSVLLGQELRERLQSVTAVRVQTQEQQIPTIDHVTANKSASLSNLGTFLSLKSSLPYHTYFYSSSSSSSSRSIGLGTPSVASTTEANHRLHMLLPRIQSRLAALAAIQAHAAEAEARSQAAPATSHSQLPAPASDSETETDSASSDTDSESGGALTPPLAMEIPIVLVTDHSDVVLEFRCIDHIEDEGAGGHAGMSSLSYHGDLSELAKEGKGKMVGPFRFPAPRCDAKELLSPQAVPRSQWTKKCRPAPAQVQQQQQQRQEFQYKPDGPLSAGRVLEIEEMGSLLEALTKQGEGSEFDAQRVRDREALGVLMERMRREIEEEGCSRKEANMIMFQVLKSVGLGLQQRKAEEAVAEV